jgi:hypothetical protein
MYRDLLSRTRFCANVEKRPGASHHQSRSLSLARFCVTSFYHHHNPALAQTLVEGRDSRRRLGKASSTAWSLTGNMQDLGESLVFFLFFNASCLIFLFPSSFTFGYLLIFRPASHLFWFRTSFAVLVLQNSPHTTGTALLCGAQVCTTKSQYTGINTETNQLAGQHGSSASSCNSSGCTTR